MFAFRQTLNFAALPQSEMKLIHPRPQTFHTPKAYFTREAHFTNPQSGFISLKKGLAYASPFFLVGGDGFEPSKLSQQIYSLPPLATRESSHIKLELVAGLEPATC